MTVLVYALICWKLDGGLQEEPSLSMRFRFSNHVNEAVDGGVKFVVLLGLSELLDGPTIPRARAKRVCNMCKTISQFVFS